jgi:hypothetical protein
MRTRSRKVSKTSALLKYMVENRITIREAIELLQRAEDILRSKVKEKAVVRDIEKR